jgi:hypothetical protein
MASHFAVAKKTACSTHPHPTINCGRCGGGWQAEEVLSVSVMALVLAVAVVVGTGSMRTMHGDNDAITTYNV